MRPSHPLSECVYVCVSMYRYERPVRRSVRPARPVRPERAVPVPCAPAAAPSTRYTPRVSESALLPSTGHPQRRRGACSVTKRRALPTALTPRGVSSTPASDVTPYDVPVSPNQCSDCRSEHSAPPPVTSPRCPFRAAAAPPASSS